MTRTVTSDLDNVLKIIVASAEKRLAHLPKKEADAVRKKIRRLAAATASCGRRKSSKTARPASSRASKRSRA